MCFPPQGAGQAGSYSVGKKSAIDSAGVAAKFGDYGSVATGYADVVNAGASGTGDLACRGGQEIVQTARSDVGDRTVLGDGDLIVRVAGKSEGAVGQRKDIAAVTVAMAVGHVLRHGHGDVCFTGCDAEQFHTELLRGVVLLPHQLGAGFCQLLRAEFRYVFHVIHRETVQGVFPKTQLHLQHNRR